MSHSDAAVGAWFENFNRDIAEKLALYLRLHGIIFENDIEKTISLTESLTTSATKLSTTAKQTWITR